MSIKSILFPWGHNMDLERQLAQATAENAASEYELRVAKRDLEDLQRRLKLEKAISQASEQTNLRLHRLIREAHFRNPATGRLGAKGQTFN